MINYGLRALHVPWWVPFLVWFGLYGLSALWYISNGYGQEYLGWRHAGRPGKIHTVLVRFHTGLHIDKDRSYGDEAHRKRAAGGNRGTVYWHARSRWFRAVRNNAIIFGILVLLSMMADWPADTVRVITLLVMAGLVWYCVVLVRRMRRKHASKRPVSRPAIAQTKRARAILEADERTVGRTPRLEEEAEPALEGVPAATLAALISGEMGCSTAEVLSGLVILPSGARLAPLPDTFSAIERKRQNVEEIIGAAFRGKLRFDWATTSVPRALSFVPLVEHRLPSMVRFRDYLDKIEALPARDFGLGVRADRSMYVQSHRGDLPMWCDFMGSGCGKSTKFLVKAAQICHKDPLADVYCIDTKQISFEPLQGIPGVYIYSNPVTEMEKIWNVFYVLNGILESRYTAVREGRNKLTDFNDIWVLGDEGNHLGDKLKNYHSKVLGETGASPAVWREAIAPLFQQGRQANIFCEWMFQDLTDRAMGGQSLKFAFSAYIAAGFQPNQFTRTIGSPAEECQEGQGRMLVCQGNKRTWTQGFYDDEQWLHDYALENRMERAA
jgi:hypothetical protein